MLQSLISAVTATFGTWRFITLASIFWVVFVPVGIAYSWAFASYCIKTNFDTIRANDKYKHFRDAGRIKLLSVTTVWTVDKSMENSEK
jgi:hypothetical protein